MIAWPIEKLIKKRLKKINVLHLTYLFKITSLCQSFKALIYIDLSFKVLVHFKELFFVFLYKL